MRECDVCHTTTQLDKACSDSDWGEIRIPYNECTQDEVIDICKKCSVKMYDILLKEKFYLFCD